MKRYKNRNKKAFAIRLSKDKPVSKQLETITLTVSSEQIAKDLANYGGTITVCPSQNTGKVKNVARYKAKAKVKTHYSTLARGLKLR